MVSLVVVTVLLSVFSHSAKGQGNVKHHRIVILDGSLASTYPPRLASYVCDYNKNRIGNFVCAVAPHLLLT